MAQEKSLCFNVDDAAAFDVSERRAVQVDQQSPVAAAVRNEGKPDPDTAVWRQIWKSEDDKINK